MSVGPLSSAFSNFTKNNVKSQSATGIKNSGLMQSMKNKADEAKETQKPQKTQDGLSVEKKEKAENAVALSEKALAYLETLKEKFGDVHFVVGDGTATKGAGADGKKYNCFISADLLEQMAADESVAAKYEGVISDAITQVDDLKAQAEAKGLGNLVKNFGIVVGEDGTVSFTAMLKDGVRDLYGKKGSQDKPNSITSNSIDGILEQLEKLEAQRTKHPNKFDSLDRAETIGKEAAEKNAAKNTDAFDNGAEAVKRAFSSSKGRKDGFDINSMLPGDKETTASAHVNKNRGIRNSDDFRA